MSQEETKVFTEDDLLPLSALQDIIFCERRCALHFIEQVWTDNFLTVEGTQLHQSVHEQGNESRGDARIARGVALRSLRLGLVGKADVVEFHRVSPADGSTSSPTGASLPGVRGLWKPFPVEYKRGAAKNSYPYQVQLCAQALCLEEMLNVRIAEGALFLGATRHRLGVVFDDALRQTVERAARRLHDLLKAGTTPAPAPGSHCKKCSLLETCLPKTSQTRSAVRYLQQAIREGAP